MKIQHKQHKNGRQALFAVLLAAVTLCAGLPAFAQPDPNDAPKGANPVPGMPFGNGQEWQKMTPEQRYAMMRRMLDPMLRGMMTAMDFKDNTLQNAVVSSVLEQETILDEVRAKHRAVSQALIGKVATDEQILVLMTELQAAIANAKTQRLASVAALEEDTHFSENPRLAAFLSLAGITGDESAYIGGVMGSFTSAMTNMGVAPPAPKVEAPAAQPE